MCCHLGAANGTHKYSTLNCWVLSPVPEYYLKQALMTQAVGMNYLIESLLLKYRNWEWICGISCFKSPHDVYSGMRNSCQIFFLIFFFLHPGLHFLVLWESSEARHLTSHNCLRKNPREMVRSTSRAALSVPSWGLQQLQFRIKAQHQGIHSKLDTISWTLRFLATE